MSKFNWSLLYQKGELETLDEKWEKCRRVQVFTGDAWSLVLNKREEKILEDIWIKKRLIPKKLTFNEVSIYVKLCERIYDYRYRVQLENTRLRMARSRRKMKAAAKKGNPLKKQLSKSVKNSNKETISQKRKRKRSDPTSN